jgi:hypothetical protein
MNNTIQNKIIYKKTEDYDNMSSSTTSDNSQINLDDSIISIDKQDYIQTSNLNYKQIYLNNVDLMQNINKELINEINKETTKNDKININNNDKIDINNNDKIDDNDEIDKEVVNDIENDYIENFNSFIEKKSTNTLNISQETIFDRLITNDINSWIFMGMIIISFTIIIMIIINKK